MALLISKILWSIELVYQTLMFFRAHFDGCYAYQESLDSKSINGTLEKLSQHFILLLAHIKSIISPTFPQFMNSTASSLKKKQTKSLSSIELTKSGPAKCIHENCNNHSDEVKLLPFNSFRLYWPVLIWFLMMRASEPEKSDTVPEQRSPSEI